MARKLKSRSHSDTGFTLIELGIVIGVIAIMATVVFTARGFIDASRVGTTIQTVEAVRKASQGFSKRQCGGAAFSCGAGVNALDSINKLVGANNFFAVAPEDAWGNQAITVISSGALNDQVTITACIGNGGNSAFLAADFERAASELGTITVGAACGTGTLVTVVTR
ncbi:MAG: type II secretion system protein [Myxococcota bacterium]